MNPSEYVKLAIKTESNNYTDIAKRLEGTQNIRLLHAAMGLCTEAGEIQDALKKVVFYNKPIDTVNIEEELGDALWYVALACDAVGADLGEIMDRNIAKLKKRFGDKFTSEAALNRDLDAERKVLENKETDSEFVQKVGLSILKTCMRNSVTDIAVMQRQIHETLLQYFSAEELPQLQLSNGLGKFFLELELKGKKYEVSYSVVQLLAE